jgi:hypothetical protein
MTIRAFAVVFAVACGGSPKHAGGPAPADPVAKPATPSCEQVAAHLVTLADRDTSQDAALRARCDAEAWSDDARGCLASAQAKADVDRCNATVATTKNQAVAAPHDDKPAPVEKAMKHDEVAPKTRGAVKKPKNADPCEGGQ